MKGVGGWGLKKIKEACNAVNKFRLFNWEKIVLLYIISLSLKLNVN